MPKVFSDTTRIRPLISIDPWFHDISLDDAIGFAKKAGFDGIEYMLTIRDLLRGPSHVLGVSKKHKMPVTSLHQPLLLLVNTPPLLFPRMLSTCKQFKDVNIVNHHLSAFMQRKPTVRLALRYKQMFESAGFRIAYESNPGRNFISTKYAKPTYDARAFQEFCQEYSLPMNLDVCHIASVNYDIVKFFSDNHQLIQLIHLSDYKDGIEHVPLTEGNLPLKELLQEIKNKNWQGTITFEIYKFINQHTKQEKFSALQKSLTFVHENLGM